MMSINSPFKSKKRTELVKQQKKTFQKASINNILHDLVKISKIL